MTKRLFLFLLINFGALALGSYFTTDGVTSDWYQELNKAPWTPPGWVFGAAWTLIMVCFSFYMAILYPKVENKKALISLFVVQWILNVAWNPLFFSMQQTLVALVVISTLTALVSYFFFGYFKKMKGFSLLVAPYLIWLLIATSLNAYILLNN